MTTVNDRLPNFRVGGKLYLQRCFACRPDGGKENYCLAVADGVCAWCGWKDDSAWEALRYCNEFFQRAQNLPPWEGKLQ